MPGPGRCQATPGGGGSPFVAQLPAEGVYQGNLVRHMHLGHVAKDASGMDTKSATTQRQSLQKQKRTARADWTELPV